MHIGYSSMNTHTQIQPAELAVAVEERGFESLWYGEHSQIPISRESPHPRDAELLDAYKNMMDPYVSLTVAGTVTKTLKLGTSVSLILERELFSQSKTMMTIDRLTGGRLMVGVGVGWNQEQFANASAMPWTRRFTAIRETAEALRVLWTQKEPEYHGELVDFDAVWCNPKPIQSGGPPLLFGAMGPVGLRHTAQWADGWMPLDLHLEDIGAAVDAMRNRVAEAGRDANAFDITQVVMRKANLDDLERYRDMGIDRCLVGSSIEHADKPDRMWRDLDELGELVSALNGASSP
jgi:probable F420-dependent oxidoreductase